MTNALVYIATNYSNFEQRATIEELDLANKDLRGELHFTELGFTNLKTIDLSNNHLTKLTLANPKKINFLDINNNQITDLKDNGEFSGIEDIAQEMEYFEFSNNPLSTKLKKRLLKSRWNY